MSSRLCLYETDSSVCFTESCDLGAFVALNRMLAFVYFMSCCFFLCSLQAALVRCDKCVRYGFATEATKDFSTFDFGSIFAVHIVVYINISPVDNGYDCIVFAVWFYITTFFHMLQH